MSSKSVAVFFDIPVNKRISLFLMNNNDIAIKDIDIICVYKSVLNTKVKSLE